MTSFLFSVPFATGIFHTLAIKNKKEKKWGITNSILGLNSFYFVLKSIREEYSMKPEHQKLIPSKLPVPLFIGLSFLGGVIHSGTFFCMGHLVAKKAYPVFQDE